MGEKVRADIILRQLEKRHTGGKLKDAFFTEVKNGSSWYTDNLLKLDAVAFKKSWKNPCITGYEVKVDRQDFLRDDKWAGYLKYCHRFYFACPAGLIAPEELPDEVGLIYYNPEKDCIRTKRRAAFRVIEMPWEMLYYLIIARLDSDKHPFFSSQRDYLEAWVKDKAERRNLAYQVKTKLVKQLDQAQKEADRLKDKVERMKDDLEQFERVKKILKKHGVNTFHWHLEESLEKALSNGLPPNMTECLERINRDVGQLMAAVRGGQTCN